MNYRKTKVVIFVKPKAKSTIILMRHIGKHIDNINKALILEIIQVTGQNVATVKKLKITRTPTLLYKGKQYVSLEKIIQILTPPQNAKEQYGFDVGSPDELIHRYHDGVINSPNDDEEDDPRATRDDEIRRKIAVFQKRRPEMQGVDDKKYIRGGRKIKARKNMKTSFDSDGDFRKAAGVDNIKQTPGNGYLGEEDGNRILEDYYNDEADAMGRKKNTKPIRWS